MPAEPDFDAVTQPPQFDPATQPPEHAPPAAAKAPPAPGKERPGMLIGAYKLLQRIGEGGMGSVWMAEQSEPVKRVVALKLIKAGMDSSQVLARFEAERQALALMDHPGIARVLDAGATDAGRPFFVMEMVKGVPITKYCDVHHLTARQRLELLVPVCQAVQHAHHKGIIHRDLKPTNILVADVNGKPAPKVIDFGLAKATGLKLTEHTMFTGFGGIVGTLEYMSPEQAGFNALDIDTRTDIYALGVVLYELLTGTTPLSKQKQKQAALEEVLRLIREQEPPHPSARLSESKDSLPSVAAQRKTEPAKLTRLVRGELDWLVMKALEKDRNRRYETANAFAQDIERYLHDEPVLASPPSAVYRLRKFAKRNKGPLAAALVVLLTLVGGMVGTTVGLVSAQQQRDLAEVERDKAVKSEEAAEGARKQETHERQRAEGERDRAVKAEGAAEEARGQEARERKRAEAEKERAKKAEGQAKDEQQKALASAADARVAEGAAEKALAQEARERKRAEAESERAKKAEGQAKDEQQKALASAADALAVLKFFQDKVLSAARPKDQAGGLGFDATIRAAVDAAEPRIAEAFRDNPLVEASVRNVLGGTYAYLGEANLAIAQHKRALELRKTKLGAEHPDTLISMGNLALAYKDAGRLTDALPLLEETLKLCKAKLGPEHPDTLTSMSNLAEAYHAAGRLTDALPLYEETLELSKAKLGPEHPGTLISMNNLASAYQAASRLTDALALYEETLKLSKAKLGPEHPDTLISMGNLASAYRAAGRLTDALPLYAETLKLRKAKLGPEHPNTLQSMNNLASAYQAAGRLTDALPLYEETLKLQKAKLGPEHPDTLVSMYNLASAYYSTGRLTDALPLLEETLKLRKAKLGPEHPDTLHSMNDLAVAYQASGRLTDALPLYEETLKLFKTKLGPEHPDTLQSMNNMAAAFLGTGRLNDAEPLFREAAEGARRKMGLDHPNTQLFIGDHAHCFEKMEQPQKAEPLRRELAAYWKEKTGPESPEFAGHLAPLGLNLLQQKKYADAEPMLRDCLAIRDKKSPELWTTFNTKSMLGGGLLGQKKYAEAEPLLLQGYEGMKQREKLIPAAGRVRLIEAMERLVELYQATGDQTKADEWRNKLATAKLKDKEPKK